jgi:phosphoglycolate phosphatase
MPNLRAHAFPLAPDMLNGQAMTAPKLAIFDFDGTIADTAPWFFEVLGEVSRTHGIREVSDAEREELRHCSSKQVLDHLGIPMWKVPGIARTIRAMAARDIDRIRLFPWVPEIFAKLAELGVTIAIVSSNTQKNIRPVLGPDLAALVTHYATGASLFGKSAKLKAAVKACAVQPARTLSIGDEVRDIEAARAAGLASVAVTWGFNSAAALDAAQPSQLIGNPTQILDAFAVLPA